MSMALWALVPACGAPTTSLNSGVWLARLGGQRRLAGLQLRRRLEEQLQGGAARPGGKEPPRVA